MKSIILLISILFLSSSFIGFDTSKEVYICLSEGATKYHYQKDCRGLNRCEHEIISVSLDEAKNKYERTLCGWED